MMRYLILIAMLLCIPVRGEAWQVVGGGVVHEIEDTYTTDTSANYTVITGTLVIENGSANGDSAGMRAWHETALSSSDMYVEATVSVASGYGGGVIARHNGTSEYYRLYMTGGKARLGDHGGFLAQSAANYSTGPYTIRLETETSGSDVLLRGYVDGVLAVSYTSTGINVITGTYCGIWVDNGSGTDHTVDNLKCGAL